MEPLLYGAARELLANVVKHAQAQQLSVTLAVTAGIAELRVADDGVGADAGTVAGRVAQGHIGLDSQRVKIEAAGGRLAVRTAAGGGTTVTVQVPVGPRSRDRSDVMIGR